jgi:hypothetical protein
MAGCAAVIGAANFGPPDSDAKLHEHFTTETSESEATCSYVDIFPMHRRLVTGCSKVMLELDSKIGRLKHKVQLSGFGGAGPRVHESD